jgi:hypothetical protein
MERFCWFGDRRRQSWGVLGGVSRCLRVPQTQDKHFNIIQGEIAYKGPGTTTKGLNPSISPKKASKN